MTTAPRRQWLTMAALLAVLLPICAVWIYPFLWMVKSSLVLDSKVFGGVGLVTDILHLGNYIRAWEDAHIGQYFLNTVFVTVVSIVITVTTVAMIGYVLGRYRFRGRAIVIGLFAVTVFLPEGYTIIPIIDMLDKLHLDSSLWGIALAESGGAHVVMILLFAGFFSRLPHELEEAAVVDGAGFLRVFWQIYLPLAKPVIAVGVILQFMHAWNDFLLPLVLTLTEPNLRTLAVGVYAFQGEEFTDWSGMMASATISLVPIIVLFLFLQRYFVEGIAGAVKQ